MYATCCDSIFVYEHMLYSKGVIDTTTTATTKKKQIEQQQMWQKYQRQQ